MTAAVPPAGVLVATVRAAVLTEFAVDSCIASTLAVIETCRYFGIPAEPQPTTIRVYTAAAWAQREALAGVPTADWPADAWSIGIDGDKPSDENRWNGHLVALAPGFLIDASLDQLARPKRGLAVAASAFQLPAEGLDWPIGFTKGDGTAIIYDRLCDGDWRYSPNWRRSLPAMRRVVGAAIRALRDG